jgi:type IV secretion system protein VirD4
MPDDDEAKLPRCLIGLTLSVINNYSWKEAYFIGKENRKQGLADFPNQIPHYVNIMSSIHALRIPTGRRIPEKMILDIEVSGLYFGLEKKWGKGYYVGRKSDGEGNVMVVGINGSGKSHVCAKSIIETWREPFVALDCKGELSFYYKSLLKKRQVKREYLVFDPFNGGVHYNPFAILKKDKAHFVENVREIAYTLIPLPPNDPNSYWINMARDLLSAIIMYYFSIGCDFSETMLKAVTHSVSEICQNITQSDFAFAKMFISEISGLKKEQQASIGTDMKQHLMVFATDSYVQDALSNSEKEKVFSWDDIFASNEAPNVFLRLNQDRLEQWSGMTRLMITQLIRTLERRPDKQTPQGYGISPILLLLDEFPLLGKIDAVTNALTTLRSKKVTFCLMIQSIAQLDAVYGYNVRKIIVDNCQFKLLLNITEPDSKEYFSRLIGSVPIGKRSMSQNFDSIATQSTYGLQIQESREPLIYPHEFATNRDIWLYTPYGFLCTYKLPVSVTHQHAYDFEKKLQHYEEAINDY